LGECGDSDLTESTYSPSGYGFGRGLGGRGRGRGRRQRFFETGLTWRQQRENQNPEVVLQNLFEESSWLKDRLAAVEQRIKTLSEKD
jgi:hypothetical protein